MASQFYFVVACFKNKKRFHLSGAWKKTLRGSIVTVLVCIVCILLFLIALKSNGAVSDSREQCAGRRACVCSKKQMENPPSCFFCVLVRLCCCCYVKPRHNTDWLTDWLTAAMHKQSMHHTARLALLSALLLSVSLESGRALLLLIILMSQE